MPDQTPSLVRPYLLTGGRTRSEHAAVDLDATLRTTSAGATAPGARSSEEAALLAACDSSRPLVEVAAELGLPLGVARVLAADLVGLGLLTTTAVVHGDDVDLLERLLAGLKEQQ